jgi:hypothetical protein
MATSPDIETGATRGKSRRFPRCKPRAMRGARPGAMRADHRLQTCNLAPRLAATSLTGAISGAHRR